MLQNKYSFNQSSVGLEIVGLPDLSSDDKEQVISIISEWKLMIVNHPQIEGGFDHLKSVIYAFYMYSNLILLEQEQRLESKLIDISLDEDGLHNIILKSTKPNIKPLEFKIGNAELSDIINCFDQLKSFKKINLNFNELIPGFKKNKLQFINRKKLNYLLIPPIIAFFSIAFVSIFSILIYENTKKNDLETSFVIDNTSFETIHVIRL